jgi:uncharacterized protein (DUF2235 family)
MSNETATLAADAACPPKTIVLFSDGTGNSSAKLFKTNVWRMYEAVDLGPTPPDRRPQIAYYDDGVGTSGFKPLAVLGGVFGYGLKRNVLDIYKYACRNYRPGDDLYAFGFSRGAFTIRLVVALIAAEGLVESSDEGELDRLSRCAYRKFREMWLPRRLEWPTKARRWVRDAVTAAIDRRRKRTPYGQAQRCEPPIRFVGVWDTVSAYGGPSVELTRAIDNWIFPLSMPDYELDPKVERARHALALDDERDAFQPLLWDEVHEAELATTQPAKTGRLQQVWFTGMHSDVGGGYPDESLSYVSLLWMMEEAEKAGLRTLKVIRTRFVALASSAGPIHDSRKGVARYYRYQPRKIAAWLQPVDDKTYGLRDPQITDHAGQPKGLLTSVKVHESVIARIAGGTDRYAPITLPTEFEIFPPQAKGENVPQADSVKDVAGAARGVHAEEDGAPALRPLVSNDLWTRLTTTPGVLQARAAAFEAVWDLVWRRRVAYFVAVGFTLLLATMPGWIAGAPEAPLLADGRTWIDAPLRAAGVFLPSALSGWVDTFADNPFYFLVLVACILATMKYAASCERRLRDLARHIWQATVDKNSPLPVATPETRLARFRNSPRYQRAMQRFKWRIVPDYVFTPVIAVAALWLGAAGLTQAYLPWFESGTAVCQSEGRNGGPLIQYEEPFTTASICHAVGANVIAGRRYRVELRVLDPWFDGGHPTNPQGLRARDMGPIGWLGGPFRRVIEANYLQPVIEIRQPSRRWRFDGVHIYPLQVVEQEPGLFTAEFKAMRAGELFVFANDAVLPLLPTFFYESRLAHNYGTASLTVVRLDEAPVAAGSP